MASTIEKSVVVGVPVEVAYNQWTQFEDFPKFISGIEEVKQIDDKTLRWKANVGFKQKEWTAQIVEQTPNTRIAWRSTTGAENAGTIAFQPAEGVGTKVTATMIYDPDGFVEYVGDFLGVVGHRVQGELDKFKEFIEARGRETGSWRGEIHGGKVEAHGAEGAVGTGQL